MKIIKFDHVTYIGRRGTEEDIFLSLNESHTLQWFEKNRNNIKSKESFFCSEQKDHDLYYWKPVKSELPVESVFYNTVENSNNPLKIIGRTIYGKYRASDVVISILEAIGAKDIRLENQIISCSIHGVFDRESVILCLVQSKETFDECLDSEGYGCLTLMMNSIETVDIKDVQMTEPELFFVNGRNLKISFIESKEINTIFELITLEDKG